MNKLTQVMQEQVWALERLRRALSRRYFKVTNPIDKIVTANVYNQVEDTIANICKDYAVKRKSEPMYLNYEFDEVFDV
jgi:glutamine synthetase type III